MATVETELKLAVTPRTLARAAQDPLLGGRAEPPQPLQAIYFDTARRALCKRGLSVRLRHEEGGWVQTIKGAGSLDSGLHRREEINRRASGPALDLRRLGASAPERAVAAIARRASLAPVFRIEVERQVRHVMPAPDSAIEISLDRGFIRSPGGRSAVCEIELELKRGPAVHVFELAKAIAERYAVRVEPRSKAARGFELIGAVRAAPVRGSLRVLRREMHAALAFRVAAGSCLNHLQANQYGVLRGSDPEYVHQARVALRRLRSVLDAFADLLPDAQSEPRLRALRCLTRALGPAREWDVFAAETLAPVMEQFPGHRGLSAIARASGRLREAAYLRSRRALAARGSQQLQLDLAAWLASESWRAASDGEAGERWGAPVRAHAVRMLARYHKRLLKRGRGIQSAGLGRLHRLRIATKRLRYAAVFFAPLFPRARAAPMLKALNDLQDALGAINDCAIAPSLIRAAAAAARGPLRAPARTLIEHWNAAMLADRRRGLKRVWKAVRRCEAFWT